MAAIHLFIIQGLSRLGMSAELIPTSVAGVPDDDDENDVTRNSSTSSGSVSGSGGGGSSNGNNNGGRQVMCWCFEGRHVYGFLQDDSHAIEKERIAQSIGRGA